MSAYADKQWFENRFRHHESGIDGWGHQWKASQRYRLERSLEMVRDRLEAEQALSILDIGCGFGDLLQRIGQMNPAHRLHGMDFSENALRGLKRKYPGLDARNGCLPEIVFESKFDIIFCLESLYYLPDEKRKESLFSIRARLNPGGRFVFSSALGDETRYFSIASARGMLTKCGFEIEQEAFLHNRWYNVFERALSTVSAWCENLETRAYETRTGFKNRLFRRLARVPGLECLFRIVAKGLRRSARGIMANVLIYRLVRGLSKRLAPNATRSHILVLGHAR